MPATLSRGRLVGRTPVAADRQASWGHPWKGSELALAAVLAAITGTAKAGSAATPVTSERRERSDIEFSCAGENAPRVGRMPVSVFVETVMTPVAGAQVVVEQNSGRRTNAKPRKPESGA